MRCAVDKLEGADVELFDLAGAQATDEPVQWYHLCSSQLLRFQIVIFGNSPPQRLHLLAHESCHVCNRYSGEHAMLFLCFTCDWVHPQREIPSTISIGKGRFSRSELEKPWFIHSSCMTTPSFICDTGPKA